MGSEAGAFEVLFPKRKIPIVLSSILQAGESLRKNSESELENHLSRRLYWRLIRIYPFRNGPLHIHLQPEIVPVDSDAAVPIGQIDFLVSCGLGAEVYFAIEAKRLRVRSPQGKAVAGNDDYVNSGMMRFISGQYAPFMKAGAMLGYVYDGNIPKARAGVAAYISRKGKELKLMPSKRFESSSILPGKSIGETMHDIETRAFTIFHIFLAV